MADKQKFIKKLEGDSADNTLTGDEGNNQLIGRAGNDVLDGGGGRDRMFGDAGDDTLVFDSMDRRIDGGDGIDSLQFLAGGQICHIGKKRFIENIEVIDFASSDNELVFTADNLRKILGNDSLIVKGAASNHVDPGGGWQFAGFSDDGNFYVFTQDDIRLITDPGLQVAGLNDWTAVTLTDENNRWQSLPEGDDGIATHVYGSGGIDTLITNGAMDQLFGGEDVDHLESYGVGAILRGGDGNDTLVAYASAVMRGDSGTDVLVLIREGVRMAEGGQDADLFMIHHDPGQNADFRILDLSVAEDDRIQIVPANGAVIDPSDLYLQPVAGDEGMYALGYVDGNANAHTIVQLAGTDLELSALLPVINIL